MLRRLQIENFALIEKADLTLADGATMITGETGSGKSMLLGALLFALGDRASVDLLGRRAERTRVVLTVDIDEAQRLWLAENDFDLDPGESLELLREMQANGKSVLRINGRTSNASIVRQFAPLILDLVGQHEAQRLLAPRYHLALLDRFGGQELLDARDACGVAHSAFVASRDALAEIEASSRQARRRYDEASEILTSIANVAPQPGEVQALRDRARMLASSQRVGAALAIAYEALGADELSAGSAVGAARTALDGIAALWADAGVLAVRLAAAQTELSDIAASVAKLSENLEYNAEEVERINERIDALDRLERRFGGSYEGVANAQEQAQRIIEVADLSAERIALAQARHADDCAALRVPANALRALRAIAATNLTAAVRHELADLALESAALDVAFEDLPEIGAFGDQRVALMFRANVGEPLRPLGQIASGGELSRVLLALIVALAGSREPTTLVFDEIDAGIGGATATAVGARIARLAKSAQVICVTHLAQIAVHAQHHAVLEKHEDIHGTMIRLRTLTTQRERIEEIARMLSGESHDAARNHARELLAATR